MGAFVPSIGLDTFFIPKERSPRPGEGSVALLSQSGAVSVAFMEKAEAAGIGISACIGLGNKADIDENDLIEHLVSDPKTNCIALYLESLADGRRFSELARDVTKRKPVVAVKAGRSGSGGLAAASHTGSLASSSDALVEGALRQAGVVRAYDEEELLDLAKALALADHLKGDRICVVASAGGFGVIAADYVEARSRGAGMRMARLSTKTLRELGEIVPAFSSIRNPVDLTAGVTDDMYDGVLEVLQKDPGVDGVMMSLELQPPNITRRLIDIAEKKSRARGAPIVVSGFGGSGTESLLKELGRRGVPAYPSIWRAVRTLHALSERGAYLRRKKTLVEDRR